MTQTVYEYKTDHDWYIARKTTDQDLLFLGEGLEKDNRLSHFLRGLWQVDQGLELISLKQGSIFHLLDFFLGVVSDLSQRNLSVKPHQGSFLVVENDRLIATYLPEEGLSLAHFFQQNQVTFGDSILIASRNAAKIAEFELLFSKLGIRVESLLDYPNLPEVAETGVTFEENARLKAESISKLTGQVVLADDSGLKVDALGGLPGVWSARFSGSNATDEQNNQKLLHELTTVLDKQNRSAQFHTTLVLAAPDKESLVISAEWSGYIAFQLQGEKGFGYDPLFLVGDSQQTAAQLSLEDKNTQSHRAQAMAKLVEEFPRWMEKQ